MLVTSDNGGHPCYAAFRSNSQSTGNSARGAHPAARLAQRKVVQFPAGAAAIREIPLACQ